jgi:hypothetical protein
VPAPSGAPAAARSGDLDAVPGREPGTRRYNVTFADRPFDLRAFRAAATGGGDAATVARIVADLEARAQAHQAPFAAAVEALGGRVERRFWLVNACTIDLPPAQLPAVRALANVAPDSKVVAGSSSRGPMSGDPLRFFPDIAACGTSIVMPLHEDENSNWVASGTSMASPEVCGAAVLVKNARPTATALELKAILLASTESIAAQNPGLDRNAYGMGFLRDDLAVGVAQRGDAVLSGALAALAATDVYALSVTAGVPCTVCLAFQRQVLTSTAWSDLSLRVRDGAVLVASSDDPRNLYERVTFTPAVSGTLVVEVAASLLETAPLPYALATTASFAGLGTPGRWEIAGGGCPGVRGRPSLFPTSRPRLGGSLDVGLAYANGGSLCLFAIGFSDSTWNGSPLPFDLATLGAPGCAVRASPDSVRTTLTDADGTATLGYAIPAVPTLAGAVLFQQAFGLDSSANALGLVASNAGSSTVGDF